MQYVYDYFSFRGHVLRGTSLMSHLYLSTIFSDMELTRHFLISATKILSINGGYFVAIFLERIN